MKNILSYTFHYKERFFSLEKKYTLNLHKTDCGIQVIKQKKRSIFKERKLYKYK